MTVYLQIGDDPTMWVPEGSIDPSQLTEPTVSVPVAAPLLGTLLISSRAASIALIDPGDAHGGMPSDFDFDVSVESLYVPTGTGASQDCTGLELHPDTNLADLQAQIATLMTEGTSQTIPLGSGPYSGVVRLNGATLPFVVLAVVNVKGGLGEPSGGGGMPSDAVPRRDS